jgi:hypothetical protein
MVLLSLVATTMGCSSKPKYAAKPSTPPPPVHCFDWVGHMSGSTPFILGGTCSCTPTQALMDKYHADKVVPAEMTLADLQKLYKDKGIKLATDRKECNNLCEFGPHVVKGGKCMVPPTPGTVNFEEVRYGVRYMVVSKKKR